jgi:hypothetical protein
MSLTSRLFCSPGPPPDDDDEIHESVDEGEEELLELVVGCELNPLFRTFSGPRHGNFLVVIGCFESESQPRRSGSTKPGGLIV